MEELSPMTDFANHPMSIAELRSDRTQNSADWTARDALISTLRTIDNGKKINSVLIAFEHELPDGETKIGFTTAQSENMHMIGILRVVELMMLDLL
jgi:hypothetical protein